MPLVEQKIDAVLLELNRIWHRLRHALYNLDAAYVQLKSSRRACLRSHRARHNHARFLSQPFRRVERFCMLLLRNHALNNSRAVAKNREQQFSRLAQIVKPSANRHLRAHMLAHVLDAHHRHKHSPFLMFHEDDF